MAFDGKWSLKEATGVAAYFDAIKSPEEYKEKLRKVAEAAKADSNAYIEELAVETNKFRRVVFINGEKKKDSGEQSFNAEVDSTIADGRPAKIKVIRDSDTKITRYENGDGFSTVSIFEVAGDQLTVTSSGNGAQAVYRYQRV
jgi:hypothetical protein